MLFEDGLAVFVVVAKRDNFVLIFPNHLSSECKAAYPRKEIKMVHERVSALWEKRRPGR